MIILAESGVVSCLLFFPVRFSMHTMAYTELPLTDDPRQVYTLDVTIDGSALHARVELRYLSASDSWVISIWDNASSELLANRSSTMGLALSNILYIT